MSNRLKGHSLNSWTHLSRWWWCHTALPKTSSARCSTPYSHVSWTCKNNAQPFVPGIISYYQGVSFLSFSLLEIFDHTFLCFLDTDLNFSILLWYISLTSYKRSFESKQLSCKLSCNHSLYTSTNLGSLTDWWWVVWGWCGSVVKIKRLFQTIQITNPCATIPVPSS